MNIKSINIKIEIDEWGPDTDEEEGKRVRSIQMECRGGFSRQPWTSMQHTGEPLTEAEATAILKITNAFSELAAKEQS